MNEQKRRRIVEAYVGEYASGKSENAVNRAVALAKAGRKVTLVDLDLVEPCFCLRPLRETVRAQGVDLLAFSTAETFGLGEAGQTVLPAARFALMREGDIIFDIGYGVEGFKILNLLVGIEEDPDLQIVLVINTSRPMTDTTEKVISYTQTLGRVDALLINTHLAEETTPDVIQKGVAIVTKAAEYLNIPVVGVAVTEDFLAANPQFTVDGLPMRPIWRFMPAAFW